MNNFFFRPYVAAIQSPRNYQEIPSGEGATSTELSVLHPISRVCSIAAMPASNQQDYFLYHPYDGTLEALYISSVPATDVDDFSIQLVQKTQATVDTLTALKRFKSLSITGDEIPTVKQLGEGPVFVRINSPTASVAVLVTAHVMTTHIKA
jgi:hypothetical protein